MAWYWIVLIGLASFALGFAAALFWLRDVVRRYKKKNTLPHYNGPTQYTQMNPYV